MNRVFLSLAVCASLVAADTYLHNPRGSNNRLNEANNNRNNGNRLFDSQNNNRGGYNVGDTDTTDGAGKMQYMVGSFLPIEWTNQHACGNEINNCQVILQYACETYLRDGTSTDTISENGGEDDGGDADKGKHELKKYYQDCKTRSRNLGLFTADQDVNGKTAIYTRQNPNGNRRGLECPEERDYYPYWHPTIWRDVAILTTRLENCTYYQGESENVKGRGYCSDPAYNNPTACASKGGSWSTSLAHSAKFPVLKAPECIEAPWNRVNHHGTTPYNSKAEFTPKGYKAPQEFNSYNWTIPATPGDKCVFRLRYNISTGDYADWVLNSTYNGKMSPIQQNPTVDLGDNRGLTLALNTNQFGRTFQDRSHVFSIIPSTAPIGARVWNLNVRGRRGNIAQVYPAVEYDFIPKRLLLAPSDYVHWQWTGSNNNPNNDGQGREQTDRSNVVQINALKENTPIAKEIAGNPAAGGMFPDMATVQKFATLGTTNDKYLDNASPYQNLGLMSFPKGTYYYMCTRNNNFSNRSQKGAIIVA